MHGNTTHGHTRRHREWHPLYRVWAAMRQRCLRKTHASYARYGGRGITICERWNDFTAFIEDMGDKPIGTSLDRINNDGNYEPTNCRWATSKEQNNNRAKNFTYVSPERAIEARQRMRDASIRTNAARMNPPKICRQCGCEYRRQGYTNPVLAPKFCSQQCYKRSRIKVA